MNATTTTTEKTMSETKREKFLTEILITAVEGGIGYWSQIEGYNHSSGTPSERGGILHIRDIEPSDVVDQINLIETDGNGTLQVQLDLKVIEAGVKAIQDPSFKINSDIAAIVWNADRRNDSCPENETSPGDIDANVADCVVQAGLFGKLVFG